MSCSQVSLTERVDLHIQIATVGERPCQGANPFYPYKRGKKIITKTAGMETTLLQFSQ